MKLADISLKVIGPARSMTLEHRMLNISNLAGAGFCLFIGVFNTYLQLPISLILICFCIACAEIVFYLLGRFFNQYSRLVIPSVVCMMIATLGSYILNGGSHGGSQYFIFVGVLSSTIITLPKYRWITLTIYLLATSGVLFIEFTHPELVLGYPSEFQRHTDVWVSLITAMLANCAVGFFIFENYRLYRRLIMFEKRRTAILLRNMLPRFIASRLIAGDDFISDSIPEATILFADIVGFTEMSSNLPAENIVRGLNQLYADFDRLAYRFQVEKIKTIGDAWMGAAGMPGSSLQHADACMKLAMAMTAVVRHFNLSGFSVKLRIGLHSGPIVCGTIGKRRIQFDVWGNTVNVASRIEESSPPSTIRWSETTHSYLEFPPREMKSLGEIHLQGLSPIRLYEFHAKA